MIHNCNSNDVILNLASLLLMLMFYILSHCSLHNSTKAFTQAQVTPQLVSISFVNINNYTMFTWSLACTNVNRSYFCRQDTYNDFVQTGQTNDTNTNKQYNKTKHYPYQSHFMLKLYTPKVQMLHQTKIVNIIPLPYLILSPNPISTLPMHWILVYIHVLTSDPILLLYQFFHHVQPSIEPMKLQSGWW